MDGWVEDLVSMKTQLGIGLRLWFCQDVLYVLYVIFSVNPNFSDKSSLVDLKIIVRRLFTLK